MAALAAVAKKLWSRRRLLVLLVTPLALLPVVFALPPKVTPPLPVSPGPASRAGDPLFLSLLEMRVGTNEVLVQARFQQLPLYPLLCI